MKSVLLVLLVTELAHAAPGFEERPLDDFPDNIRQIVALDGGGAYALGVTKQMKNHAVWIASDGTLQRDPIPDELGAAYHVTPDLAWMLGTNGVAHREVDGLRVIETPIAGMPTWGRIVALSPTSALVSRAAKLGGFIAYELDTAGNVSNALELPGLELTSLIPDGLGGAWALVTAPYDGYVGYAKYERGTWTLWRTPGDRKPLLDGFRLAERVVHDDLGVLVPDGRGGCLAVSQRALFQITASGALIRRTGLDGFRGVTFDRELDQLQMFTWPRGEKFPPLLLRFDREGHLLARDAITVPAIAPYRPGAEWASIATRDGRTWIAVNSFVFRFERGVFTAFYSGPERRAEQVSHQDTVRRHEELMVRNAKRSRASVASASIGSILALGGGALAVSAREEKFLPASLAVTAGAVGSFAPVILLDEVLQHTGSENPMGNLAAGFGTVVGLTGTTLLGALGSWGTIEAFSDSGARGKTFGGAVLGAAAGTLISTQILKALRNTFPNHYGMRLGIAASLIGTAATIGARAAR